MNKEKNKFLNRIKKHHILIISVLLFLILGALGSWYFYKGTVQYSLSQIKEAYQEKDFDKAMKFIKIDTIFDNLYSRIFPPEQQNEDNLGYGLMLAMKPVMKEAVTTGIKESFSATRSSLEKETNFQKAFSLRGVQITKISKKQKKITVDGISFVMEKSPSRYWQMVDFDINEKDLSSTDKVSENSLILNNIKNDEVKKVTPEKKDLQVKKTTYTRSDSDLNTISELTPKFSKSVKSGITYYVYPSHLRENSVGKSLIKVAVNEKGDRYLLSQYSGDSNIFHNSVVVNIKGVNYFSNDVSIYDSDFSTKSLPDGSVQELVTYDFNDDKVIKAIAENQDAVVKVLFQGYELKIITLSAEDKNIIKMSFDLANALRGSIKN